MKKNSPLALCVVALVSLAGSVFAETKGWSEGSKIWLESVALETAADYRGALARMPQFLQASGDQFLTELRSGWLAYQAQEYDSAVKHYTAASRLVPSAQSPLMGLGNSYLALNKTVEATRVYEQALKQGSENTTSLKMLGGLAFQSGDYRRAAQAYGAVLESYPEDTTALSGYAWALVYQNRKRDAESAFLRLLLLSPDFPYAQQGYESVTGRKITTAQRQ